jgi:hypothetical protein
VPVASSAAALAARTALGVAEAEAEADRAAEAFNLGADREAEADAFLALGVDGARASGAPAARVPGDDAALAVAGLACTA